MNTSWRKSSHSGHDTECVEVGLIADRPAVRDTKCRHRGHFTVPAAAWRSLTMALGDAAAAQAPCR